MDLEDQLDVAVADGDELDALRDLLKVARKWRRMPSTENTNYRLCEAIQECDERLEKCGRSDL